MQNAKYNRITNNDDKNISYQAFTFITPQLKGSVGERYTLGLKTLAEDDMNSAFLFIHLFFINKMRLGMMTTPDPRSEVSGSYSYVSSKDTAGY